MSADSIPEEVRRFILQMVDSVAELEGLLLLKRAPEAAWTAAALSTELYVTEQQAEQVLQQLHSKKLLRRAGAGNPAIYRYGPGSESLEGVVDRTADAYSKHLIAMSNLIHSKPQTKVQQFADAFKITKEFNESTVAEIYTLCALTALLCAWLLFRGYGRSSYRLLLWGGFCFVGLTLNNLLLILDKFFVPFTDLSTFRLSVALLSSLVFLYGLIWDSE